MSWDDGSQFKDSRCSPENAGENKGRQQDHPNTQEEAQGRYGVSLRITRINMTETQIMELTGYARDRRRATKTAGKHQGRQGVG